jgi:pimeloyl-ACP methyl ester carboxylesterase
MPVLALNAQDAQIDSPDALRSALADRAPNETVTLMVHGYRFCPFSARDNPHHHILSLTPQATCWKAVSWPRHLHLNRPGAGLGIAFGWTARGRLAEVAAHAFVAGDALAQAIRIIRDVRPDLKINLIAHSLGARVALAALAASAPGAVRQMVLLSGAEYRSIAADAIAGKGARILNVTSGENAMFDALFRALIRAPSWTDRPLAAGLDRPTPRWIDLAIDAADHRAVLTQLGFATRSPSTRICHWSGYLRPGLFPLYRGLFDPAQDGLFDRLGNALPSRKARYRPQLHGLASHWRGTARP